MFLTFATRVWRPLLCVVLESDREGLLRVPRPALAGAVGKLSP